MENNNANQNSNLNTNTILIVIGLLIFVGVIMWYFTQSNSSTFESTDRSNNAETQIEFTLPSGVVENESNLVTGEPDDVAFSIAVSSLPQAQQLALQLAGVDDDELHITNGMVLCAEADFGSERVVEIQNGSSPSMSESITLIGCYNENQ